MRTSLKTSAAAGTVTVMVLGGAVLAGSTSATASSGRQLAGTWAVSVDPDGDARPPFTSTLVYTATGSVVETTMNRPPSMISTGLGTWERLGDGRYEVTHRKYRWSSSGFLGTVVVHEVSEVAPDGDSYTSRATATFLGPDGRPDPALQPFSSTVTAERL